MKLLTFAIMCLLNERHFTETFYRKEKTLQECYFLNYQSNFDLPHSDYSITRANFHGDLNFTVHVAARDTSLSMYFFSRSVLVRVPAEGTLFSRTRPFFISVKYFIKQVAFRSRRGGRHTNSERESVTRRSRFIMAAYTSTAAGVGVSVLRTSRRENFVSRISHDPSSALCS